MPDPKAKNTVVLLSESEVDERLAAEAPELQGGERIGEPDLQLLAWAVSNCHTLALREIRRLEKGGALLQMIDRWKHVQRICEKAGARSKGVLRASLPTEITDGSAQLQPNAFLWQPIETLIDCDREVLLWTPIERLFSHRPPFVTTMKPDMRISTRRLWTWATHWAPKPDPPVRPDAQES